MNFCSFHCHLQKVSSLKNLVPRISKVLGESFNSVFSEAAHWTETQLAKVGLRISVPLYAEDLEIFISKQTKHVFGFRLIHTSRPGSPPKVALDILEISPENKEESKIESLGKAIGANIEKGSFIESIIVAELHKRLGKLSPNGKILADSMLRQRIRRLYNDNIRSKMKEIVNTYGENVLPLETIRELLKEKKSIVKQFFDDPDLFIKKYVIVCDECGTLYLTFSTKEKAESALSDSHNYCSVCGKGGSLNIYEGYAVAEAIRRGIQQGLWLESLAADVTSEFTHNMWIGQMIDANEIDVLSIYCDKVVLIECKDASFGQNDFYVTAMKAQDIQANIVIIITTHDIHPNVQKSIDRYKGERRIFRIISKTSTEEIQSSLRQILSEIQNNYVTGWLRGELVEPYFSPYARFYRTTFRLPR